MIADILLFDLGGVVLDIDFERVFERWAFTANRLSDELEGLFPREVFDAYQAGRIDNATFHNEVCSALDVDMEEVDFFDGWNRVFVGEMPDIYDLLQQATRNRYPLFLFSNTNAAHETYIRRRFHGVLRHFKSEFLSHRMGLLKPDAAAFQVIIDEIGPAEKILFFDDTLDNVEAAQLSGMRAVLVNSDTTVQDTLRMT